MELKAKVIYHNAFCSLTEGETTEGLNIPLEVKKQMLADFPEWFEEVSVGKVKELVIETPEDSLVVETTEAKAKSRKK